MSTLKNVAIFIAGGFVYQKLLTYGITNRIKYPRIGSVVFENDEMTVIRLNDDKNPKINLAAMVYKNQSNEES